MAKDFVFFVSHGSPVNISSRRTESIARAFALARQFPSVLTVWDKATGEPCLTVSIRDTGVLKDAFDLVRDCL